MIQLYVTKHCPYCKKVEACLEELGLEYQRFDVGENPAHRNTVQTVGGKMQTPFFIDEEPSVHLYESDAIIAYLTKEYGDGPAPSTGMSESL